MSTYKSFFIVAIIVNKASHVVKHVGEQEKAVISRPLRNQGSL